MVNLLIDPKPLPDERHKSDDIRM